eukprot:2722912-Rhodomonas_salina.1
MYGVVFTCVGLVGGCVFTLGKLYVKKDCKDSGYGDGGSDECSYRGESRCSSETARVTRAWLPWVLTLCLVLALGAVLASSLSQPAESDTASAIKLDGNSSS